MKKIYFLNTPTEQATSNALCRNRLKNTYKSTDPILDIIDSAAEGREFYVTLIHHGRDHRRVFHMNPPGSPEICTDFATKRPVLNVIEQILRLTRSGEDIDICLFERQRGGNPDSGRHGPNGAA